MSPKSINDGAALVRALGVDTEGIKSVTFEFGAGIVPTVLIHRELPIDGPDDEALEVLETYDLVHRETDELC